MTEVIYSKTNRSIIVKDEDGNVLFTYIGIESKLAFIILEMGKHTLIYKKNEDKFSSEQIEVACSIVTDIKHIRKEK